MTILTNQNSFAKNIDCLEVSYFVNNSCNLNCKHCYVDYNKQSGELSLDEWKVAFNDLIRMGALTFGNVGKEPLLNWEKTKELLIFLKEKRKVIPKLRFGMVTNATLLNKEIIMDLEEIFPNYIDVSLDGYGEAHDYIRGIRNFERTVGNLKMIKKNCPKLLDKIFISFTLMSHNKESFTKLMQMLLKIGVKNIIISPYVKTQKNIYNNLGLNDKQITNFYKKLIGGILFSGISEMNIIIKNDYDTLKGVMDACISEGIIDMNKLFIDEYGTIFNKYISGTNSIIVNYLPYNNLFSKSFRITHDGYISSCYAQFFKNIIGRADVLGNIRCHKIKDILDMSKIKK
jgi:MoaA/NifB/PqqE/SkfB family radical SAM enzyme